MEFFPWYGWVAIVGAIMVFTYAIVDIVTKRKYAGRQSESMQSVSDAVRTGNREVIGRLDVVERRLEQVERRLGGGP